jgi:hypothetical protein
MAKDGKSRKEMLRKPPNKECSGLSLEEVQSKYSQ